MRNYSSFKPCFQEWFYIETLYGIVTTECYACIIIFNGSSLDSCDQNYVNNDKKKELNERMRDPLTLSNFHYLNFCDFNLLLKCVTTELALKNLELNLMKTMRNIYIYKACINNIVEFFGWEFFEESDISLFYCFDSYHWSLNENC